MITEDYISYETAKLLKEKGFVVPYDSFRGIYINGKFLRRNPGQSYLHDIGDEIIDVCSIQMAMKWLREVHNLYIWVEPSHYKEGLYNAHIKVGWWYNYWTDSGYDTYKKACEAAIKYCLEILI